MDWDNIQSNAVSAASATVVGGTTVYAPNGIFAADGNTGGEVPEQGLPVPALLTPTKTRDVFAAVQNMHEFGLFNTVNIYIYNGYPNYRIYSSSMIIVFCVYRNNASISVESQWMIIPWVL